MRNLMGVLVCLCLPLVLLGCGGGTSGEGAVEPLARGSAALKASPTMAQLRADLTAVGKPMPEFLGTEGRVAAAALRPEGEITTQNMMSALNLSVWSSTRTVPKYGTMWFECYVADGDAPTDVSLSCVSGDSDLFVFSPFSFSYPEDSLWLVGYSVSDGNDTVGSFYADDWGGPGRFVAAAYGYLKSNNKFKIRFW